MEDEEGFTKNDWFPMTTAWYEEKRTDPALPPVWTTTLYQYQYMRLTIEEGEQQPEAVRAKAKSLFREMAVSMRERADALDAAAEAL